MADDPTQPEAEWLKAHGIVHPKKRAFLLAYAQLGTITHAARAAQIARRTHYDWLEEVDEEGKPTEQAERYRAALDDAHQQGCENLEREAIRRAVDGVDEPVYQKGERVGTIRKYSDVLLIFMLKGAKPEKYRERFEVKTEQVSDEQLDAKIAEYIRKVGISAFTRGESAEGPNQAGQSTAAG